MPFSCDRRILSGMEDKEMYAVVTGATSGIGLEFARLFAEDGINLVIASRGKAELEQVAKELRDSFSIEVHVVAADLTDIHEAEKLYHFTKENKLPVYYIVNNAGFGDYGDITQTSWSKEQSMIALNITSLTYLSKMYAADFAKQGGGHIVNVASTAAFQPGPLMAVYYATKSYVLHFSEAIASELHKKGVRVTALCPGPTASKFQEAAAMTDSKLVAGKNLPTAAQVARYGYKAMKRGRVVAIHGANNKLNTYAVRFLPRRTVRAIVHRAQTGL